MPGKQSEKGQSDADGGEVGDSAEISGASRRGAGGWTFDHRGLSVRCRQCDEDLGFGDRSDRSSSAGGDLYGENAITT